jgi:hypothetical protein
MRAAMRFTVIQKGIIQIFGKLIHALSLTWNEGPEENSRYGLIFFSGRSNS